MRIGILLLTVIFLYACGSPEENRTKKKLSKVDLLIQNSIKHHFQNGSDTIELGFGFRNRDYSVDINPEGFRYECIHQDTLGQHIRTLTNSGYREYCNNVSVDLEPKDSIGRGSSVNSVVYFALLPLFLQDEAVLATYSGVDTIKGAAFDKLEVRFSQEGGGEDFQDIYYYWLDQKTGAISYLAYSYQEEESGSRFRKAYNPRRVNGILFQDFENYEGPSPDSLRFIRELFDADSLKLLSKVELSKLHVQRPKIRSSEPE